MHPVQMIPPCARLDRSASWVQHMINAAGRKRHKMCFGPGTMNALNAILILQPQWHYAATFSVIGFQSSPCVSLRVAVRVLQTQIRGVWHTQLSDRMQCRQKSTSCACNQHTTACD